MLPSSALRNCTVVKYISFRPHFAQVCCVRASVRRSAAVKVWTADRFALRAEGKELGFDSETIVLGIVSENSVSACPANISMLSGITFIPCAADAADDDFRRVARGLVQKVSAVVAEDQGANGRHDEISRRN